MLLIRMHLLLGHGAGSWRCAAPLVRLSSPRYASERAPATPRSNADCAPRSAHLRAPRMAVAPVFFSLLRGHPAVLTLPLGPAPTPPIAPSQPSIRLAGGRGG